MKIFAFLFASCLSTCLFGQRQANIWYFGDHAGMDFNRAEPVSLTDGAMRADNGSSVISDADGKLIFYTNGVTVWNRNHQVMPNGRNLWGNESTTQTLIIPQPGNDSIYFIFTASPQNDFVYGIDSVGFHYSTVDMSRSNGFGAITKKNVLLFKNTTEKMTAIRHENGRDVWLVTHEWGNNSFRSYPVTGNGIDTLGVVVSKTGAIHQGGINSNDNANARGQMKLSPNGKRLALATYLVGIQLFDFNAGTGQVSNPITIEETNYGNPCFREYYGVEFSPNCSYLYYDINSNCPSGSVYQFDILKKESLIIAELPGPAGALQLATDGRIYAITYSEYLGAIERPNVSGANISFVAKSIHLESGANTIGLPNFIQSDFLLPDPIVEMPNVFTPNDTDTINAHFAPMRIENVSYSSIRIFNRWGEQVFSQEDTQVGWDGGGLSVGVYYWILYYEGKNGEKGHQKGWVQLLR